MHTTGLTASLLATATFISSTLASPILETRSVPAKRATGLNLAVYWVKRNCMIEAHQTRLTPCRDKDRTRTDWQTSARTRPSMSFLLVSSTLFPIRPATMDIPERTMQTRAGAHIGLRQMAPRRRCSLLVISWRRIFPYARQLERKSLSLWEAIVLATSSLPRRLRNRSRTFFGAHMVHRKIPRRPHSLDLLAQMLSSTVSIWISNLAVTRTTLIWSTS